MFMDLYVCAFRKIPTPCPPCCDNDLTLPFSKEEALYENLFKTIKQVEMVGMEINSAIESLESAMSDDDDLLDLIMSPNIIGQLKKIFTKDCLEFFLAINRFVTDTHQVPELNRFKIIYLSYLLLQKDLSKRKPRMELISRKYN